MNRYFRKIKIFFTLITAFAVCVFSTVPALAADSKYIPLIPEFLTISGDKATLHAPINQSQDSIKAFFSDFYQKPFLILLSQWTHTDHYPVYNGSYVGSDKQWFVHFVKPSTDQFKNYQFIYSDPAYYDNDSQPMKVFVEGTSSMEIVSYKYDFANKRFGNPTLQQSVSQLNFSYVIGSALLSHAVTTYPYYDQLAGNTFTVVPYVQGGAPCHYSWWIGKKSIGITDDLGGGGDGDHSSSSDSSSGDSSSSSDSGSSSSSGDSSDNSDSGDSFDPTLDHPFNWHDKQEYEDLKNLFENGNYLVFSSPDNRYDYILDLGKNPHFDKDGNGYIAYPDYIYTIDTKNPNNNYIIKENNNKKPVRIPGDNIISSSGSNSRPNGTKPNGNTVVIPTPPGDIHLGDQTGSTSTVIDKKPGQGSGGIPGDSSGGSGSTGTDQLHPPIHPPQDNPNDYDYKDFHLFDPFDDIYDKYQPPDSDPWGYDPLDGIQIPDRMPEIPYAPNIPDFQDPFHIGDIPNFSDPFYIG